MKATLKIIRQENGDCEIIFSPNKNMVLTLEAEGFNNLYDAQTYFLLGKDSLTLKGTSKDSTTPATWLPKEA